MKVSELIKLLETVEDKDLEIVIRVGANNGANFVVGSTTWVAKDNTNVHSLCDVLLPDSNILYDGYTEVLVLQ